MNFKSLVGHIPNNEKLDNHVALFLNTVVRTFFKPNIALNCINVTAMFYLLVCLFYNYYSMSFQNKDSQHEFIKVRMISAGF